MDFLVLILLTVACLVLGIAFGYTMRTKSFEPIGTLVLFYYDDTMEIEGMMLEFENYDDRDKLLYRPTGFVKIEQRMIHAKNATTYMKE